MGEQTLSFALNHMTVPSLDTTGLLDLAVRLGCVGVELRNDLDAPLFDGHEPGEVKAMAEERGLRILAIAQIGRFNRWSSSLRDEAHTLVHQAAAAGAEAIALIPANDGDALDPVGELAALSTSLRQLKPMLEDACLTGLIEPLGFAESSLRFKRDVMDAVHGTDSAGTFRLIHDTFHHHVAAEAEFFASATGMVHLSGVADTTVSPQAMRDSHRLLVDARDRLGNLDQLNALLSKGYAGPCSFECFAKTVHELASPQGPLEDAMAFISGGLRRHAA